MNSKIKLAKKSGLALLAICLGMAISLTACGSKEGTSGDKDSGNQVKSLVNKDGTI